MDSPKQFLNTLVICFKYIFLMHIDYGCGLSLGVKYTVPAGFCSDGSPFVVLLFVHQNPPISKDILHVVSVTIPIIHHGVEPLKV